ncbi:helix-turn-helix transcriptional regulator [Chitinophaga filiformis]|uniref:AraC family transcriptional regulator n=1 Tax=Chitinophaga filiformis TaxID=104663 RepID=UPI001F27A82F|nr:AraC family transcriptional regulator [Chitinophaga filiformis]MCF6404436.1 helix-turn-helix transcriptional regulator [Chitinophaga filiformis]
MKVTKFQLRHFITKGEIFHLARVKILSRDDISLHNHDYAEIFWIEHGGGTHLINGKKVPLNAGDLVMIRAEDQHTFASSRQGITMMNLAFPLKTVQYFRKRYFTGVDDFFWKKGSLPYQTNLDVNMLRNVSHQAEKIWKHQSSSIHLDSFLLLLFRLLLPNENQADNQGVPAWLNNAVQQFPVQPDLFRLGARGFASICGRNMDHVNRTVRKCYNKTLSALVAELRMQFAARQLAITNAPIKSICHDCGFNNLGHFYKQFQGMYKQTPSQYRDQHQRLS